VLRKFGSTAQLYIGSQFGPLDPVQLEPARALPLRRARQLALFA
jgi:hypothetical protein